MKEQMRFTGVALAIALIFLAVAPEAWARETITIQKANGGNYNITAYNNVNKTYYFLNGSLTSDSHGILVPNGYGCTVTVTLNRAVGNRNLYEQKDRLNPILEVTKKSSFVLELIRKGYGPSFPGANAGPLLMGAPSGGSDRQPPP